MNQLNLLIDTSTSTDHSPIQKKSKIDLSLPSEKVLEKSNRMCTRSFHKPCKPNHTQAIEIRPLSPLTNQNQSNVIVNPNQSIVIVNRNQSIVIVNPNQSIVIVNPVKTTKESREQLITRLMGPK